MKVITSVNAKGGCGKSTLASNVAAGLARLGHATLLIDMDPQAQVTGWYRLGRGLEVPDTIAAVLRGDQTLMQVIQRTHLPNLSFVASAAPLEELGQRLRGRMNYEALLLHHLRQLGGSLFDYIVIDSPNQVSPIMQTAIYATDLFLVPFLDTHSVLSYPNVHELILKTRPDGRYRLLPVLNNLSNKPRKRRKVIEMLPDYRINPDDAVEVRYCAALGEVDTEGGSVFEYYPLSNGARDIAALVDHVIDLLDPREGGRSDGEANEQHHEQETTH